MKNILSLIKPSRVLPSLACFLLVSVETSTAQWITWDVAAGGNGHQYMAVPGYTGLTWNLANTLAQQQGGYLASITSQAENDFVFGLVNSPQFFNSFNGGGPAIGGILGSPADGWHWTSGEAWGYTNWGLGLPNNGPNGDDRLAFYSGRPNTPAPTWDDIEPNDAGAFNVGIGGYVVERNAVPEPSSVVLIGASGVLWAVRFVRKTK